MYGDRLLNLRNTLSLSQQDVAKILGIERNTYSEYETEYTTIPINHLNKLCNYFNVSFDYIFNFSNTRNYNANVLEINSIKAGKRLKEIRKDYKYTQENFGSLFGIAKTTVCGYEHGARIISTTVLYDICKTYNVSADYLLAKTNTPKYLKK